MEKDSRLGRFGKDLITNFEGVIIGKAEYLTGCTQLGLTPRVDKDGKTQSTEWFDEGRILIVSDTVIRPAEVKGSENGGPNRDAPRF